MDDDTQDPSSKTHEPTEHRLRQAREREGQVPISQDFKLWFIMVGAMMFVWLVSPFMMRTAGIRLRGFIAHSHEFSISDQYEFQTIMGRALRDTLVSLSLPFMVFVIAAIAGTAAQIGFMFTPKRLAPNWKKFNIANTLKEILSSKKLIETAKSALKLFAVLFFGYLILKNDMDAIPATMTMDIRGIFRFLHSTISMFVFTVVVVMAVFALFDLFFQRFQFRKKMRMSAYEVKKEHKETEGDPQIKSRIHSIRMERYRKRMMQAVPNATVVITNPTHYAVAIDYNQENMAAPRVVAKGLDFLALKIREVANENGVPIVENPPLARALYASVEVDQEIPIEHYKAVAEVLGYVYKLSSNKRQA